MHIARTFDPSQLNWIVNDPAVHRWVARDSDGAFDLSSVTADRRNVCLETTGGGMIFHWKAPGLYEIHTMFRPTGRVHAIDFVREAFRIMFEDYDAQRLVTMVAENNRLARALTLRAHMKPSGVAEEPWVSGGESHVLSIFSLTKDEWRAECL